MISMRSGSSSRYSANAFAVVFHYCLVSSCSDTLHWRSVQQKTLHGVSRLNRYDQIELGVFVRFFFLTISLVFLSMLSPTLGRTT